MDISMPFNDIRDEHLTLQLSTACSSTRPTQQSPPLVSSSSQFEPIINLLGVGPLNSHTASVALPCNMTRTRRTPTQILREGQTEDIPAPYPWATTRRAHVYSLHHLFSNGINKIRGMVQCKKCDQKYEIEYDLEQKFGQLATYVYQNKSAMRDRAPDVWMNPILPDCKLCGQTTCVKPVIGKKRSINWLFLCLGQLIGCCKLNDLKYFCKHTKNHRTGAKDRVLYLTYMELLKQLDPNGPFDI
ncbi:uncharacterized protein LOC126796795 [Argentina anserina]|uniref:uncharacterized protein LOC126796795 n=1 Tax=Argentina anserina TaxID=57926 RepID=UPI0021763CDF|nr:uncharacterized protein LOC126796795 [Potentilla anserina]